MGEGQETDRHSDRYGITRTMRAMDFTAQEMGVFWRGLYEKIDMLSDALWAAMAEGRNVLPDATDDQAHVIEAWAIAALGLPPKQGDGDARLIADRDRYRTALESIVNNCLGYGCDDIAREALRTEQEGET